MKTVFKKMLSLVLVAMLLVSAVPFQASATQETLTVSFVVKSTADGSQIGTHELVMVKGDPCYAGKIISQVFGCEVENFYADGTAYGPDDSFVPADSITVRVNAKPAAQKEEEVVPPATEEEVVPPVTEEEVVPPVTEEEVVPPVVEEQKPVLKTLTVTIYVVDLNGNAKQYGDPVKLQRESFTLNQALAEEVYKGHTNFSYRWQGDVEDGAVNLIVSPVTTEDNKKIVTLTLMYNFDTEGAKDRETITLLAGDNILKAIKDAKISISRPGYYLDGWCFDMNCTDAVDRKAVITEDMKVFAEWEKKSDSGNDYNDFDREGDVLLRIYLNEYTRSADKVVDMEAYDNDGKITYAEAAAVVKKYYKQAYSNDDMDIEGLFTYKTWNSGDYDMDDAVSSIKVNEDDDTIIYVMVRDAKRISSGVADSSNPKTGDAIYMAVTVMALSGTALAAAYIFSKKRAVK